MKTLTINLPDSVDLTQKEALTALAAQLYEMGSCHLDRQQKLRDIQKREFMELLADYGVSVFNNDEDFDKDVENATDKNIKLIWKLRLIKERLVQSHGVERFKKTNYRITPSLEKNILKRSGEM